MTVNESDEVDSAASAERVEAAERDGAAEQGGSADRDVVVALDREAPESSDLNTAEEGAVFEDVSNRGLRPDLSSPVDNPYP